MRTTLGARLSIVSVAAGLALSALLGAQIDARAATDTPLAHFVCYSVTHGGVGFKLPPSMKAINQLTNPGGAVSAFRTLDLHCAPTQQRASSANAAITNPSAHQVCWAVSPKTAQPVQKLHVTNQFGTATLLASGPVRVCVPAWSKPSSKIKTPPIPPGLSHFSCYAVAYAPGSTTFHPPAPVLLDDTILGKTASATVGAPKMICVPTVALLDKNGHTVTYVIQNTKTHLLCFAVKSHAANRSSYDQTSFGTAKLSLAAAKLLCETSNSLSIIPPTTTTGTPSTTTMAPTTTTEPTTTTTVPDSTTTEATTTTDGSTTSTT